MHFSPAALSAVLLAFSTSVASAFTPPAVFKNANLVHVLSLEKNYVKETINVVIENIDKAPQHEYYLPFSTGKISHVGGLEVKDRKVSGAGPFTVEAVEIDPESDTQYFRISLPAPLQKGAQQTLGISYYVLDAYRPLPATIAQNDKQYLVHSFSAYCPSAYATAKQKTEVKFPSDDVPDYTLVPSGGKKTQKQGSKITYGPFDKQPAGAVEPVEVRFEFTKPLLHVDLLERDIEVSHWGGNVAFEERYELLNHGANLSTLFNRVKWAQAQYYNGPTSALKEMLFPLRAGSVDAYYTDIIGNVSTSRFRTGPRDALLTTKPRYPVFGGWKYPFTIGWNSNAQNFLRKLTSGTYVLNVPFLEGPRQPEGIEYEKVRLQVLLPEGAENVKYYTSIPTSSITETTVSVHKTYLDTIGRTSVVIQAQNLVDEFRDRELVVSYEYSLFSSLRKPIVIFASTLGVFVAAYVIGSVELKFSKE